MPDLIGLLGIRLQLFIGRPDVPLPAPYDAVDALISLEVTNNDRDHDGFQMEFSLGRDSLLEYSLLRAGVLDIGNRVIIMPIFGALPQVLIDGIITDHQVVPSNEPGRSTLKVTGLDISVKLSFEDKNVTYPNQSDSNIVKKILADAGFMTQVTETSDTPKDNDRIPTQQCDSLRHVRRLAQRNGYIFYVEPTNIPGVNLAYWGPEKREGESQPALSMNMGPQTNVDTPINFHFNALGPTELEVSVIDPFTGRTIKIPNPSALLTPLTSSPARPLRKTIARDTANLSYAQALLKAVMSVNESSDAIDATGEVDATRYGRALRARRKVDVRGAGRSYDGGYYVQKVVHKITRYPRGEYKQSFSLTRDGRGSTGVSITPSAD
ncbi:MAG: hypothetical protein J2P21_12290 [Chloracidobacterium sp.]|nr:hypothetical protein [Chloracidobacterium sp.]